jgi:hypothetical protein
LTRKYDSLIPESERSCSHASWTYIQLTVWGKKDTPDPSGTGSSDFPAESNVTETIEKVSGVFEMLQKAHPDIPFEMTGDCAGPFCEGCLPSIRNRFKISSSGSGFIIRLCSMEVLKRSFH